MLVLGVRVRFKQAPIQVVPLGVVLHARREDRDAVVGRPGPVVMVAGVGFPDGLAVCVEGLLVLLPLRIVRHTHKVPDGGLTGKGGGGRFVRTGKADSD